MITGRSRLLDLLTGAHVLQADQTLVLHLTDEAADAGPELAGMLGNVHPRTLVVAPDVTVELLPVPEADLHEYVDAWADSANLAVLGVDVPRAARRLLVEQLAEVLWRPAIAGDVIDADREALAAIARAAATYVAEAESPAPDPLERRRLRDLLADAIDAAPAMVQRQIGWRS